MVRLIQEHLENHKRAYGSEHINPKHHFSFHNAIGKQVGDIWLDCFVHERKHQVVKQAGSNVKNTSKYECSVLGRVLLEQRQLENCILEDTLLGQRTEEESLSRMLGKLVTIAKSLQHNGLLIGVADSIVHDRVLYVVKACVQDQTTEELYLLLQECRPTAKCATHSACQLREGDLSLLLLDDSMNVSVAHCWTQPRLGSLTVLHPHGVV